MNFFALRQVVAGAAVAVSFLFVPVVAAQLPDFTPLVERQGAAVVNISTRQARAERPQMRLPVPGIDESDPMFDFFRRYVPKQPEFPGADPDNPSLGSGFIISADGYILTNAHVVEDAEEILVRLADKREYPAQVIGADVRSDVALIKIEASGLPSVTLGDPDQLKVGEWVLAIGSPYGFESSASAGIVSAKSRSLPDDNYVPFIQTDVAVNPGNSGGPLFNMAGEVIGINSQIYSRTGGYQGLSFAIPIDVAMSIQDQIMKHGKVQRGRLGVSIQEVNQSLAESFGLSKPAGALISSVESGSPAAKAGLESGDVILAVNGKEIQSSNELPPVIANIRPGENAKLQIWRKGGMREIEVKVGGAKDEKTASVDNGKETMQSKLGLALRTLTPEERRQFNGKGGLVVENVSGAAAKAGIRRGDVVLSVNGEPVANVEQLRALVAKASKRVALLIQRGDAKLFVPVDLG